MNYSQFIDSVIRRGIAGAKESYKDDPIRLDGSIAGFEACRSKTPEQLSVLLMESGKNKIRAHREELPDYWKHACYHAEIEWVCNCLSAILVNEGIAPIIPPTARGVMNAIEILAGK